MDGIMRSQYVHRSSVAGLYRKISEASGRLTESRGEQWALAEESAVLSDRVDQLESELAEARGNGGG